MTFARMFWLLGLTLAASLTALPADAQPAAGQNYYVVTVDFGTAPENFERFKQIMNENAKASVSEETGCREFNVYEIATTPNHLFLFEVYDDEAAFQRHVASAHFKHSSAIWAPIITSNTGTRGTMFVSYHRQ